MNFKEKFLSHYLAAGMGSFSKRDIDVLIMHLLNEEGTTNSIPLKDMTHQQVSFLLRTPITKIKSLRYEAALKYGGSSDNLAEQAKIEFFKICARAKFEVTEKLVCFVIEDTLTKNWLQGELKKNGLIFDNSFNTEIVKVSFENFCDILQAIYGDVNAKSFVEKIKTTKSAHAIDTLKKEFFKGLAKGLGGAIPTAIKSILF